MAKKKKSWLQMPKVHSKYRDESLEAALISKAIQLLSPGGKADPPSFIFLCGNFFDVKGYILVQYSR